MSRPRLAFVSPVFLFPADAGGKIRTGNILRGLKGGAFDITLLSPATQEQQAGWADALAQVCDRFEAWMPAAAQPVWRRALDLVHRLPVNVAADARPEARRRVQALLHGGDFDLVVFDFVHAAVLRPADLQAASVCFTHNVEAEIFQRHAATARNPAMRAVWASQHRKMRGFEREALGAFDAVVAVSQRDAEQFRRDYGLAHVDAIPTGVDLDFFAWTAPPRVDPGHSPTVVFTGSMDWQANVDGVGFFLDEVWPLILRERPDARFVVVGRHPPAALVSRGQQTQGVQFTGFVDDVRPYARAAQAFVIPLRVGGGTRIKAFEAMAMGCPVVSTAIGIEGLDVEHGRHYLLRDAPADLARGVLDLFADEALRQRLSLQARACMEERFGHRVASQAFERICLDTLERRAAAKV